tara:strand:+ start:228 stop:911 length:684 start_codon:yes stop_codon:yes gene_type:complete
MIIWLASYPKSGNTWVRSIISSLLYTKDGVFNFQYLKKIKQFPHYEYFKDFISDENNIHEIKKAWIIAQEKINLDKQIKFFKTHQGNYVLNNYPFTNSENTLATIYVTRDPRNLISSISNHYEISIEDAFKFIKSPKFIQGEFQSNNKTFKHIKVLLGNWTQHYDSWTQNNKNLLIVKYEDLIKNPLLELKKIIEFLNKYMTVHTNNQKNENIIKTTSFENLKKMEN